MHGWIGAFSGAEAALGERGDAFAHGVLKSVRAMRSTRRAGFAFMSPDCPDCARLITLDERAFIAVLHAQRRDRGDGARSQALIVCRGKDPTALLAATGALASLCRPELAPEYCTEDCNRCASPYPRS
ncbi:MAG: hypothetical protein AAF882_03900 [Pseudomonadota bacterium]